MKKVKKAAVLKYEENIEAPMVTAKGKGTVADNIIKVSEENNIPIVFNEEMADLLSNVDVGEYIPGELYQAVAEVIAFVMQLDNKK